ncbi:MAG: DUF4386 domain-containing protein [Bacteroidota bacterium]
MTIYRKTSIIIGVLFIVGTISGITSAVMISPYLHAPDYLVKASANEIPIILGTLFVWLMGFSLALIPLFMYPIFKKHNEVLAIGYVIFRGALEMVTYIAIGICMLLLLNLSQDYVKAGVSNPSNYQNLGSILLKARELSSLSTIFVFGLGALMFYLLLFQSKLIPRWLSIWGLIAIALHIATGLLIMFKLQSETSTLNTIMNFPIFLQEMVMAVWLIVKGFNSNEINSLPEKE